MSVPFHRLRDFDEVSAEALIGAVSTRASVAEERGASVAGRSSVLSTWQGRGRKAADSAFGVNRQYAESAASNATELAKTLRQVVDARTLLKQEISNIIEDGAQMRFTISDSGMINDFYGQTGLASELSGAEKARYEQLKAQLPARVEKAIATGEDLDHRAATALAKAANLQGPPALGDGHAAEQNLGDGVGFTKGQGMAIFKTGDGDDTVSVKQLDKDRVAVTVNGKTQVVTNEPGLSGVKYADNILIQTQGGNDRITVPADVTARVRIQAGAGNDIIDDKAIGGSYIDAGAGDDTVTLGGGHNTVYLDSGTNTVTGSTGADYINGGTGKNTINAGSGASVLYGGASASTINAGTGKDTIYTGSGNVTVNNQGGQDTIYSQADSHINEGSGSNKVITVQPTQVPDSIHINGSPEFQQRVMDDLQMLSSSPDGQSMLSGLGHSGHTLTIDDGTMLNDGKVLYNNGYTYGAHPDGTAWNPDGSDDDNSEYYNMRTGEHGAGTNSVISIDTTLTSLGAEPVQGSTPDYHELNPTVVLYHEMAHAYDYTNGTMMPGDYGPGGADPVDAQTFGWNEHLANAEREAVGLPVDWDGKKSTKETPAPDSVHPTADTENALRDEMGLPDRQHYLG